MKNAEQTIRDGESILGIELGSTRIKAVLIDGERRVLASGSHTWENRWEDGYWTYSLEDAQTGLQAAFAALAADVSARYGVRLEHLAAIGVSGMMHGYLPFDAEGRQLAPFRTWRSTTAAKAAEILTRELNFKIPIRWSVSHLYQAVIDGRPEVPRIAHLTTLAGWAHERLSGEKVLGVCEASGMFPIDPATCDYDAAMVAKFDALAKTGCWRLKDVLPRVRVAGQDAGTLTPEGAKWLDPTGTLQPGARMCPPEGDAGTGMVATDAVEPGTGNVSAGTSVFAMVVMDRPLSRPYPQLDVVATPFGKPVAMAHCNNGTSDIDAWMRVFAEVGETMGVKFDTGDLYAKLFGKALEGAPDCGGIDVCNFVAAEPLAGATEGCPSVRRRGDSDFTLANLMRAQLRAVASTLKIGMDILTEKEGVRIVKLTGHGGYFKTPGVGEKIMSEVLGTPVTTLATAGEGGAWGIAVLASLLVR